MFNIAPLHHGDQFAFTEQRQGWRRRTVSSEVTTSALGGFNVLTSKNREDPVRLRRVLQGRADGGPHAACGTSADRIHDDHRRSLLRGKFTIYFSSSSQFLNAHPREFFAHGNNHQFRIHSASFS